MESRRFRSLVFKLHTWLGIHAFLFLSIFFLTGSLLVFADEIEAAIVSSERLSPAVAIEDRASFGELYETARDYRPGTTVVDIIRSDTSWIADRAVVVIPNVGWRMIWFGGPGQTVSRESGFFTLERIVLELHKAFFIDHRLGGILACSFAVVLLGFTVTGAVSYRRFWRGFFRWPTRQNGSRGWWGGLHRLLAVWSLPFLIITGVTGTMFLVDRTIPLPFSGVSLETLADRQEALPAGFNAKFLDEAVKAAIAHIPSLEIKTVRLPDSTEYGILVLGDDQTVLATRESTNVLVDPATMAVADSVPVSEVNPVHRLLDIMTDLHFGEFGGLAIEILWAILGILATMLAVAGAMVFAARTESPEVEGGATRRMWSASILTKLGYPAFFVGLIAVIALRMV